MSEGKRVSLQSIGPAKKDKKCKPTSTTIRLTLTLPACNSDSFADFNYNSLILNEKRKKDKSKDKDEKANGGSGLDPYASDDEEDLRQIARSFESKYGTPKKKCRRLEDYTELGTGYDENDSFIDNTDAYDEVVPEDQTPELDGFYINKGQLILKHVHGRSSTDHSDSDDSDGPKNSRSQKRPLSSESESSSSGSSSDDSDDSDGSEDSEEEDDEGNEETEGEMEGSPRESNKNSPKDVKDEKSNGHVVSPVAKKPKLLEVPSKKVKNKAITGLFIKKAVSEKEHHEKRQKIDSSEKEPNEKRLKIEITEKDPVERHQKLDSDGVRRLSNVDAAIEAVARGEDSKESGIAESKSRSGSSDESDTEESPNTVKVNGQSYDMTSIAPPLPEDLPENVLIVISSLKEVAVKNSNLGKQQFFTSEVNALLLRFEKLMRTVPRDKKGGVYDHLECFVPCRKETFMKRGKALLLESVEAAVKEPLARLKAGIDAIMPSAVERYVSMCKKCDSNREAPADQTDAFKPSSEKTKIPRRRFPWTEDLKNLLCLAVKKRRVYYGTVKQKGETWEEHLREFLKNDVLPMWQNGWMKVASLLDIIAKMAADLLQFKPVSPGNKVKKSLPCPTVKKMAPKATPTADDAVKSDLPAKIPNALPSGLTMTPKPLQIMNHQNQNNSVLKANSESGAKSGHSLSNGAQTITSTNSVQPSKQPSNLPPVSQTSSFDLLGSEIVECIRTSLANSLVSVTPVQSSTFMAGSSQASSANVDSGSKVRNAHMSSAPIKKALNSSVDIINLQTNGMDSSVEIVPKKRLPAANSSLQNLSTNISQTPSTDLQDLSKPQSSSLTSVPSSLPSQLTSSHQSTSSSSSIKVSSVSAINLKLGGTQSQPLSNKAALSQPLSGKAALSQPLSGKAALSQPLSGKAALSQPLSVKAALSQPLKAHTQQNVPASSSSVHQSASSYSSQSVISHGLEPGSLGVSSSLTITPVKPNTSSNTYYQQTKASGHSNTHSGSSSVVSQLNSSARSEVIVTPSGNSSMPHIKSTNVNFSASITNSVSSSNNYTSSHSSGNNFPTSLSGSSNTYTNSRGISSNSYQSSLGIGGSGYSNILSSSDVSVRTHRQQLHTNSQVSKGHSSEKNNFAQPSRSHAPDKTSYLSSNIWPSAVSVDIPRSSSSPSSVKSVTPSPEKAMVSRKDRILQDSRERGSNDPVMPTLSGPYRSTNTASDPISAGRNQTQAKTPQSLTWDDELVIIEDFLKMSSPSSSMPQNTHKVSTASLDSYKHTLPILEPQRCDNVSSKSSHLDPPRAKNLSVPTTSEPQRVNVVMPTPQMHTSPGYTQHNRDQPRANAIISNHTIRDIQRPSSAKSSSSNPDSQRENVVMATPRFQEALRDEMSDILAAIPTQMISRTDHYTITNSMPSHNSKRKSILEMSDLDLEMAVGAGVPPGHTASSRGDSKSLTKQEESLHKAQERAMQGILMSRTNCDGNYLEEPWGGPIKKTVSNKSSNDISDQRLSGMRALSSSLSMTGLDDMGLGLPSHLVGFQNDYQRHLYGSSSKTTGPNDHRPL